MMNDKFKEWTEDLSVAGSELRSTVEQLMKDMTVHRLIVRKPNGEKFFELPAIVGVASGILLWKFALITVGIARLANYRIVVIRREDLSQEEEIDVVVEEIIEHGEFDAVDKMAKEANEFGKHVEDNEIKIEEILIEDDVEKTLTPPNKVEKNSDLSVIKGIGPKYRQLLAEAGIRSFAELAEMQAVDLQMLLKKSGARAVPNIALWIEQAKLAAAEEWETLEKLQNNL